ncbi:MAG: N-acetylmuramoyl-L-alanine amidase [Chloroflexia bacterium]
MADQLIPSQFFFDSSYLAGVGVQRPRDILFVVLHHSAGIESSDIPWLTTQGQVSVHRYVSRAGTRYQLVADENAAWGCAVGAEFEFVPPRLGTRWAANENWPTLQFEMENRGSDPFTDPQYEAAADWTAGWVQAYGIPGDRRNIVGHRELTRSPAHQDPNDQWDWTRFMALVQTRLTAAGYIDYYVQGPPTIARTLFVEVLAAPPNSPIADQADQYYDCCTGYGVDPAVALAFFVKESDRGTAGIAPQTLSWGNQRRAWRPERTTGTLTTPWGPFAQYKSWLDSLADWCELLLSDVYQGEGRTTVRSVLPKYAPASENNTALYIQQTIERITGWKDTADTGVVPELDLPISSPPTISRERFRAVLQDANSPALAEADTLYDLAVANGVNPAVALAFFVQISRAGTAYANPAKAGNHNWGEVLGDGAGLGGVQAYPSWAEGLRDWIRIVGVIYAGEGMTTVRSVAAHYHPGGTANTASYAQALIDRINAWREPTAAPTPVLKPGRKQVPI